jgi:hypothetical protein
LRRENQYDSQCLDSQQGSDDDDDDDDEFISSPNGHHVKTSTQVPATREGPTTAPISCMLKLKASDTA